jgi:hypothetical protein
VEHPDITAIERYGMPTGRVRGVLTWNEDSEIDSLIHYVNEDTDEIDLVEVTEDFS